MSVVNGVIKRISPTMINAFDAAGPFGCERRGWFKYVAGRTEPTTPEMTRGTHLHAMNEEYLRTGRILLGTSEQTAWFNRGRAYLDALRTGLLVGVEQPLPTGFTVEGIPVSERSKCDVVTESAIIDWKTTKSSRYFKTPGQLARDVQLLTYAKAFHPLASEVTLTHGYYVVEQPTHFEAVSVGLSRQELDDNYGNVIVPLVARMREVVKATEAKEVKPNRDACRRCPHQSYCPPDRENPIMGIFGNMKKPTPLGEGIKPEVKDGKPFVPFTSILPPDAPKSEPALAAKPVEGFQAVPPPRKMTFVDVPADPPPTAPATPPPPSVPPPQPITAPEGPRRGPGRPKGAKNKPAPIEPVSPERADYDKRFAEESTSAVTLDRVEVSYGLTLNLGNYNSARLDMTGGARFTGSFDLAAAKVLERVKAQVEAEVKRIQEATQLNPGGK